MNSYEQMWLVATECDLCGEDMEISEYKYVEMDCRPLCELCELSCRVEDHLGDQQR